MASSARKVHIVEVTEINVPVVEPENAKGVFITGERGPSPKAHKSPSPVLIEDMNIDEPSPVRVSPETVDFPEAHAQSTVSNKGEELTTAQRLQCLREHMSNVAKPLDDKPAFEVDDELSEEACQYIYAHWEDLPVNDINQVILPLPEPSDNIYLVKAKITGDVVRRLGLLDPFIWRANRTTDIAKVQGKCVKRKTSAYVCKDSPDYVGQDNMILGLTRIIYTLPDDKYILQYLGNMEEAVIHPKRSWVAAAENEMKNPKKGGKVSPKPTRKSSVSSQSEFSDSNSDDCEYEHSGKDSEDEERYGRTKSAKLKKARNANPLYVDVHTRMSHQQITDLLNPARSGEVAMSVPKVDHITQPDAGLVYLFDVSKTRCDWKRSIMADTLRMWKRQDIRKGTNTYVQEVYYIATGKTGYIWIFSDSDSLG